MAYTWWILLNIPMIPFSLIRWIQWSSIPICHFSLRPYSTLPLFLVSKYPLQIKAILHTCWTASSPTSIAKASFAQLCAYSEHSSSCFEHIIFLHLLKQHPNASARLFRRVRRGVPHFERLSNSLQCFPSFSAQKSSMVIAPACSAHSLEMYSALSFLS